MPAISTMAGLAGWGGLVVEGGPQTQERGVSRIRNLSAHELRDPRMAYAGGLGDSRPFTSLAVQCAPDLGVELVFHAASIAIFCECGKQHIANQG